MDYLVLVLYSFSLLLIFLFSLGQLHLTWMYRKDRKWRKEGEVGQVDTIEWPIVTVQLPLFNEKYVAGRLIDAVANFNYPSRNLEIQVLDDSTDDTSDIVEQKVQFYKKQGLDIKRIARNDRYGFKAGALQNGLELAKGEVLAIFDADFVPEKDFLLQTTKHFNDQNIGLVQTRWGHLNHDYSILTQLQAFGLDAHFTVEQTGRSHAGSFINFNGTGGVWRKSCIIDAGGWSADTLTEDLDLSYRAQMKGWKFKYLEEVVSPAELPVLMPSVKNQQYRWNKGAAETAMKNLGRVLAMPFTKIRKIHAAMHLLNSSIFIPLLMAALLSVPVLFLRQKYPELSSWFHLGSIFLLGFFSIGMFYWTSTMQVHRKGKRRFFFKHFPLFLSLSMGLSLHNSLAVLEGLFGHKTSFVRTPKFNITKREDSWKGNVYFRTNLNWMTIAEGMLGLYFLFGIGYGLVVKDYGLLLFHLFLAFGFLSVCIFSIMPLRNARA